MKTINVEKYQKLEKILATATLQEADRLESDYDPLVFVLAGFGDELDHGQFQYYSGIISKVTLLAATYPTMVKAVTEDRREGLKVFEPLHKFWNFLTESTCVGCSYAAVALLIIVLKNTMDEWVVGVPTDKLKSQATVTRVEIHAVTQFDQLASETIEPNSYTSDEYNQVQRALVETVTTMRTHLVSLLED